MAELARVKKELKDSKGWEKMRAELETSEADAREVLQVSRSSVVDQLESALDGERQRFLKAERLEGE